VASISKLALKALDPTLPSERLQIKSIQNTWTHSQSRFSKAS